MKNRSSIEIFATILSVLACFACLPQMKADPQVVPAPDGCYPNYTTAEGCNALFSLVGGAGNTAVGWYSQFSQVNGDYNTSLGAGALDLNRADMNTAVGTAALLLNTTGSANTAVGTFALLYNASTVTNVAVGQFAAEHNDESGTGGADFNTAVGGFALQANVDGTRNTAVGAGALEPLAGGSDNTAVGELAGANYTGVESRNISVGSGVQGVVGENNTIRIGPNLPTGAGLSQCFIGGILSKFTPLAPDNPLVTIDPVTQQLGWTMDFSANKVAEQQKKIEEQQASIAELKSTVAQQQKGMEVLTAQLREQAAQIQKVSAQLEVSKPAPQVVVNKP